jgi:glucan biosynthesis protein C
MEKRASTRLYYLDWVRVLGILTVFVYHSTRFFNPEDWHVNNPTTYAWVEVWNRFAVAWMMPLFFVISGASLFFAVGRRGARPFVKDKVLRLLVPLLVGDFTHASLQVYLERHTHGDFSGTYLQFIPHYFEGFYEGGSPAAGNFALTGIHLWYLWWLFLFSILLYPLMRWLKGRGQTVLGRSGEMLARPAGAYALALPTLLLLLLVDPTIR